MVKGVSARQPATHGKITFSKGVLNDDIHEIREANSKMFESMKSEDICKYIKEKADSFLNNKNKESFVYA